MSETWGVIIDRCAMIKRKRYDRKCDSPTKALTVQRLASLTHEVRYRTKEVFIL